MNRGFLVALCLECPIGRQKARLNRCVDPWDSQSWCTECHVLVKNEKGANLPNPCPPFFLPSSIYLCCSCRTAQNLTQYILPRKWNKEVCLQLGLDGDHLLDVFQGLPPLSLWRHCCCFCFSYVLNDSETGRPLTVWRIIQASLDTNAENMHCVEK